MTNINENLDTLTGLFQSILHNQCYLLYYQIIISNLIAKIYSVLFATQQNYINKNIYIKYIYTSIYKLIYKKMQKTFKDISYFLNIFGLF